jgi:leader peptidase (prepilin peptidase) / N-methyltransferase
VDYVITIPFLVSVGLCWGSFLNVIAYRLMQTTPFSLLDRSHCTSCSHQLAWYDLIPVVSWFMLEARCRYCSTPISWLYPFIELISATSLTLLALMVPLHYFFAYFIFFSALIITIRTDAEYMLISQLTSVYLAPVGIICSQFNLLPISTPISLVGAASGYVGLYTVAKFFKICSGKDGLGQGDIELLACIGAFTGPWGCWTSLFIGSIVGSAFGILYIFITKKSSTAKIPFGPFLALGAIVHVLLYSVA